MAARHYEPYHEPNALQKDYKKNLDEAVRLIREGLPPHDAFVKVYGLHHSTWYHWRDHALEDIENGYTDTPLVNALVKMCQADIDSHHKLVKKAQSIATDGEGNVEMIKFLLERRYGYKKKSQKEVEVTSSDDFNFNINITEAKDD